MDVLNAFNSKSWYARWWCHNVKLTFVVCFTICNDQINMRLDTRKCERDRKDGILVSSVIIVLWSDSEVFWILNTVELLNTANDQCFDNKI